MAGGAESGVVVFQDFFVDINFPATLTRGDEVSFPIAVYNYLSDPQSIAISPSGNDVYASDGYDVAFRGTKIARSALACCRITGGHGHDDRDTGAVGHEMSRRASRQ